MTNGGTGPLGGSLLLVTNGRGLLPPSLVLVNPHPPYNTTVLLDNFYGRQFNSFNDVKVHPISGKIFITDPRCVCYGISDCWNASFKLCACVCYLAMDMYMISVRKPLMPNQVYRFDQDTSTVRVVADGFDRCNGLAFTGDGKTAYV
jgi:gluconolactonase